MWIENRDFQNWQDVMATTGAKTEEAEKKAFYWPRPGHADLAGHYKYGRMAIFDMFWSEQTLAKRPLEWPAV